MSQNIFMECWKERKSKENVNLFDKPSTSCMLLLSRDEDIERVERLPWESIKLCKTNHSEVNI